MRERERERERVCVCVWEREREREAENERVRKRERGSVPKLEICQEMISWVNWAEKYASHVWLTRLSENETKADDYCV